MRRAGLIICIVTLMASALVACTGGSASLNTVQQDKPNIVFVLTDDLSNNLVPYLPHVLAMEKSGTSFSHYYVVDSLCCPSRSAIFTSEYPHDDGVYTNSGTEGGYHAFVNHGDNSKSFALTLQKAGYRTAMMGKYLNQYEPKDPIPPGWGEWDVAGGAGYQEFKYTLNENGKSQSYGSAPSDYLTDVMSGKAVDFIDSSAAQHKPFMLELATFAPHKPATPAPRYANVDMNVTVPHTPAFNAAPKNPPAWLKGFPPLSGSPLAKAETQYRLRVQSVLAVDDLIARVEKELQDKGLSKDTYFIFSSDNGFHIGEYRMQPGKQTEFDTDINVPLVVTGPGVPAGRVDSSMVSSIDLAPTFDAIAGTRPPSTVDGVSALDLWHGHDPAKWQNAVLVEHHYDPPTAGDPDAQGRLRGDPPDYEAVRTADALLVRYKGGELEYYDTKTDPYELDNQPSEAPPALVNELTALENCHNASACQKAAGGE